VLKEAVALQNSVLILFAEGYFSHFSLL